MSKKVSSKQSVTDNLDSKIEELTADLQRVHADFVNYRRRSEAEQSQIMAIAKQAVVAQLLPLIDNLERVLGHVPTHLAKDPWAKGVAQVAKQAEKLFQTLGVEKIVAKGRLFDPHVHEAVGFEEGTGKEEVITEEIQTGYRMGEQVIRPSLVRVGKR